MEMKRLTGGNLRAAGYDTRGACSSSSSRRARSSTAACRRTCGAASRRVVAVELLPRQHRRGIPGEAGALTRPPTGPSADGPPRERLRPTRRHWHWSQLAARDRRLLRQRELQHAVLVLRRRSPLRRAPTGKREAAVHAAAVALAAQHALAVLSRRIRASLRRRSSPGCLRSRPGCRPCRHRGSRRGRRRRCRFRSRPSVSPPAILSPRTGRKKPRNSSSNPVSRTGRTSAAWS